MWFTRKRKNRYLHREHVLDVKLRSRQVRNARLRLAGMALTLCFGSLFTMFVFWRGGEWLLNRFVYENSAFAIREIDVQTDGAIDVEQLRRWAGVKAGENLLALDLARVKRDLELVPVIESAAVERALPGGLRIRVREREAVAQIHIMQAREGGAFEPVTYHLDESGFVFPPLDPRLRSRPADFPPEQLPIVSGISARDARAGHKVDNEQVLAALELVSEFDFSPMLGLVDLYRIDASVPELLHVYTGQGNEIVFALKDIDKQLRRWRMVHDRTQAWGKSIALLDLSVSNNVPLRLAETAPLPPPSKTVKPPRTKRKNV